MKLKFVVPRQQANQDVDEAIACYVREGSAQAELGFIDALEQGYAHIGGYPGTGSLRYAHELDLPGLRAWQLTRHPHLLLYFERPGHMDVWRVLHGQRDIPAWMREPEIT